MTDFIIIGNKNAPASVSVLPLFKDKVIRFGYTNPFFDKLQGLTRWITTLPVSGKKKLNFTSKCPCKYDIYDNYDAIEVGKIKDIPNYDGNIGVPITIFDYCLDNIDIIGLMAGQYTTIGEHYVLEHLPNIKGKRLYTRVIIREKK